METDIALLIVATIGVMIAGAHWLSAQAGDPPDGIVPPISRFIRNIQIRVALQVVEKRCGQHVAASLREYIRRLEDQLEIYRLEHDDDLEEEK